MIHLHVRSWFSFLAGGSSPESLAEEAARLGQPALALTDTHGFYGAVRFARACKKVGVRPLYGATLWCDAAPLVFLAQDREGYANLSRLIGTAHRDARKDPCLCIEDLRAHAKQLFVLTGGRESRLDTLVLQRKMNTASRWLELLKEIYGQALFIELAPSGRPGDRQRLQTLLRLSQQHAIPCLLSNDVRYARRDHFPHYDAMTCVRLGLTVDDPHPQRPVNDRAYLCSSQELLHSLAHGEAERTLYMQALERTQELALQCQLDLLPEEVTPPSARLPHGLEPKLYLRQLCQQGMQTRYEGELLAAAQRQLEHELSVVEDLDLSEFFLVVHEVTDFARSRDIRYAGRGSAANSIIAYLLGITAVDPLLHHLLFERFLHRGRKGMPDIDVDFDSERRPEVIAWMEERFGAEHCAMTGTLQTYQARGAMREMMKILGWDPFQVDRCCKLVEHWSSIEALRAQRGEFVEILGETPLLDVLLNLVEGMIGCPRHLGLHNGGMVLTRKPLPYYSPIQTSAGGFRQVQFDKDDVEALGLIKFDVLGLRMLAVLSEAVTMHREDTGEWINLDRLPSEDPATYDLICSGETMSLFQIESPGQMNLLSRTQPRSFRDLVIQVALFRPGPIQGGMVNPFLQRRAGLQKVEVLHSCLEPILRDTYGIIVFQEQVLEICHQFAGLSLEEADRFRSLMSKWRDPGNMEAMGEQFIEGAMQLHGVSRQDSQEVFRQVAAFVGYGFCRSHAAAFARTVYQSAYLKRHYPAAYMASVMQHLPGFFPQSTIIEEARRLKVKLLPVCIMRSGVKYHLEQGAIRLPFTQVKEISIDAAEKLVEWREHTRPQDMGESLWENLLEAVPLELPQWESLARSGAFQALAPRREALWRVGLRSPQGNGAPLLSVPRDIPRLAPLGRDLQLSWDFSTQNVSAAAHPVSVHRRRLEEWGIVPLARLKEMPADSRRVKVAGWVLVRQRPPTAKGMAFIMIEDETDRIQIAVPPPQMERWGKVLLRCQALLVVGRLEGPANGPARYRGLMLEQAFDLEEQLGRPLLARDDSGLAQV